MRALFHSFLLWLFPLISCSSGISQDSPSSWTHFRGNELNGISREIIPVHWDNLTNIAWRTEIPGAGWSSPVVLGDQVWLTTATAGGKEMRVLCVDLGSGKIVHDRILFRPDTLHRKHSVNTYATPTSALEEGSVYVHFGRYGTACLDTQTGETRWMRTDLQCEHIQGPGSSLLIYRDKLIVHMEGSDAQYIVALDKRSGKTLWRTERPKELYDRLDYIGKKAYTTPIIIRAGGRELMISNGSAVCIAYDPQTGEEVWRYVRGEDSTIAMPVESDGVVYFYTSFETDTSGNKAAELVAADPSGKGDIGTTHVLWKIPSPPLQLLSPLVLDGLLYTVDSQGTMYCLDASSGETVWSGKMKGKFHSSPVYANGNIYFSSTTGKTYVMKAGRKMEQVAENTLEGQIWASPAVAGGAIIMRTDRFLYKIREP